MRKLSLRLDDLAVESFEVTPGMPSSPGGTVLGASGQVETCHETCYPERTCWHTCPLTCEATCGAYHTHCCQPAYNTLSECYCETGTQVCYTGDCMVSAQHTNCAKCGAGNTCATVAPSCPDPM